MTDSTARAEAENRHLLYAQLGLPDCPECCGCTSSLKERVVELTAEVERLTRERDEAIRGNLESGDIQVHGLTMRQILELKYRAEENNFAGLGELPSPPTEGKDK